MSSILTNTSSMVALQTMKSINMNLAKTQGEISTGKAVASAKDNAAVWAISKVMESDVKGFKGISDSLSLGSTTIAVARQAAEATTDLLIEIKQKIVAAQESNVDREKIQTDIVALRNQISSVVNGAQFYGLNMVDKTGSVDILSSLDRSGTGVTASKITVTRQDLSQTAARFGAGEAITMTAAAPTGDGIDANDRLSGQRETRILVDTAVSATGGQTDVLFEVGGVTLSVDLADSATQEDIATAIAAAINGNTTLQQKGITAGTEDYANGGSDADGWHVVLTSAGGLDDIALNLTGIELMDGPALEIYTVDSATGEVDDAAAAGTGAAVYTVSSTAATFDYSTIEIADGSSFRLSFGSGPNTQTFEFVASADTTAGDIAVAMAAKINARDGFSAEAVRDVDGVATGALRVAQASGAAMAVSVEGFNDGKAAGGLAPLAEIDVSTAEGAALALSAIENMINRSIDASAAFGSAQGRIDIQNEFITKLSDSLRAGIGTLVDANMEEAAARLQALQVQQQLATQSLSIANQQPQNILALFR